VRDFNPGYVSSGVICAGLRLGRSLTHFRSTPDSDRKFKAHLFVAICRWAALPLPQSQERD